MLATFCTLAANKASADKEKEVGNIVHLSKHTVYNHLKPIYEETGKEAYDEAGEENWDKISLMMSNAYEFITNLSSG